MTSKEPLIISDHGFILFNKAYYILNLNLETVFIKKPENVFDFTNDGKVFGTISSSSYFNKNGIISEKNLIESSENITPEKSLIESTENIIPEKSLIEYSENIISKKINIEENKIASANARNYFVCQSVAQQIIYEKDGEVLLDYNELKVFKNTAKISNIIACSTMKIMCFIDPSTTHKKTCVIVLSENHIFMIYDCCKKIYK